MLKEEIDRKYLDLHKNLENEFFNVIGKHRELKEGKLIEDFNEQHRQVWRGHETELIENGYLALPEVRTNLARDLDTEITKLMERIENLEKLAKIVK